MNRAWSAAGQYRAVIITVGSIAAVYGLIAIVRHQQPIPRAVRRVSTRSFSVDSASSAQDFTVSAQRLGQDNGQTRLLVYHHDDLVYNLIIGRTLLPSPRELSGILLILLPSATVIYERLIALAIHDTIERLRQESGDDSDDFLLDLAVDEGIISHETSRVQSNLAEALGTDDFDSIRRQFLAYMNEKMHDDDPVVPDMTDPAINELKALLYHIADDKARRKAFLHRGIRCEQCGESPIRSVRWHCLNCPDYDLCSSCKVQANHPSTHVFAEILIPIPVLAQPVDKLPLWYSGKPGLIRSSLTSKYCRELGQIHNFQAEEIDALSVQFSCLVDTPLEDDRGGLHAAIGFDSFVKSLSSSSWRPHMRTNPILGRIFAFYDTEKKDCIDFEAFVSGISYLRGPRRFQYLDRAIRGFDMDGDGWISRADCQRLLQAKFEIHSHIIHEMALGEEAEQNPLTVEILSSSRPVSAAFRGDVPPGRDRQPKTNEPGCADIDRQDESGLDRQSMSDIELTALGLASNKATAPQDHSLLWSVISQALDEKLDRIFKTFEDRHTQSHEPEVWRAQQAKPERRLRASSDPLLATALHASMLRDRVPTDTASLARMEDHTRTQSLDQLLDASGYGLREASPPQIVDTAWQRNMSRMQCGDYATKNGQVCLMVETIEEICQIDNSGELAGLMRSWLEWATF